MPKRETLQEFVARLPQFSAFLTRRALESWQRHTLEIQGEARNRAPYASGNLVQSLNIIRARVGAHGVESAVYSDVPYARPMHSGTIKGKPIRYKDPGEISYYVNGKVQKKHRKGDKLFISSAAQDQEPAMIKDLKEAIGWAWDAV